MRTVDTLAVAFVGGLLGNPRKVVRLLFLDLVEGFFILNARSVLGVGDAKDSCCKSLQLRDVGSGTKSCGLLNGDPVG